MTEPTRFTDIEMISEPPPLELARRKLDEAKRAFTEAYPPVEMEIQWEREKDIDFIAARRELQRLVERVARMEDKARRVV